MENKSEDSTTVLAQQLPSAMRVLSVDVGIKNLAYCLLERPAGCQQFSIRQWDTVDLSVAPTSATTTTPATQSCAPQSPRCCAPTVPATKKGKKAFATNNSCNKPAKFRKADLCYCLQHAKKQTWQIPTALDTPAYLRKQSLQGLLTASDRYGLLVPPTIKKAALVELLQQHVTQHYYEKVVSETKSVRADEVDLVHIGRNLRAHFDALFLQHGRIDFVIIENQISPIATRMKTIQGMIVQYFLMSGLHIGAIEFINASNKLKVSGPAVTTADTDPAEENQPPRNANANGKKTKYSDRKKQSVSICQQYLQHDFRFQDKQTLFAQHRKQDDLADAFLQGLWYLSKKNQLNTTSEAPR